MAKVGLVGLESRQITEVFGGQLQLAGICRTLISKPQIIFCDEPTGALNSKMVQGIMTILLEGNLAGTTLMLVTYDAKIAFQASRVLFMQDGELESEMNFAPKLTADQRLTQVLERMKGIEI